MSQFYHFNAKNLEAVTTLGGWPVTLTAPSIPDDDDANLTVIAFDDTTAQARGAEIIIPSDTTRVEWQFLHRARTPNATNFVVAPNIQIQEIEPDVAVPAFGSALTPSVPFTTPNNTTFQLDTFVTTHIELGVSTGSKLGVSISRNTGLSLPLAGDWYIQDIFVTVL